VAVQLLGDSIYTNPLMLGYAWQKGRVPLSHASLMRAMELNGVQVANNQAAFEWGRRCAHDLASVQALFAAQQVIQIVKKPSVDELVARRIDTSPATRTPPTRSATRPSSTRCARPSRPWARARRCRKRWRATCSS
jgi:hypothetical protein